MQIFLLIRPFLELSDLRKEFVSILNDSKD